MSGPTITLVSMTELTARIVEAVTDTKRKPGETIEDYFASVTDEVSGEEFLKASERAARAAVDYFNECVVKGAGGKN